MNPILFSLTLDNDIVWRYVVAVSTEPAVLKIKWFSGKLMQEASDIYIEHRVDSVYFRYRLKYIKNEGELFFFENVEKETLDGRQFCVDHKSKIKLEFINREHLPRYLNNVYYFNMEQKNIANQISSLVSSSNDENRSLVKFMIHLNSKMDQLFDILGQEKSESLVSVHSAGLHSNGFIIYSEKDITDGTMAYTKNTIGNLEARFTFAAVIEFNKIKKSTNGFFYSANFVEFNEDIKDMLVKYLFSKERELIKEIRDFQSGE